MYEDRARLLFMDTDILCYVIETNDFYEDIQKGVPVWFDTSDFHENLPAGLVKTSKKVLEMMKDECKGKQLLEVVALRPKAYAIKI